MIFAPDLAAKILNGKKTVTRRPVKLVPNLQADGWDSGGDGMVAMPCRYREGRTYAVQPGRGKKQIGRIRILSVERQSLGWWSVGSLDEAHREGFSDPDGFVGRWISLYGSLNPDEQVWRIEFQLADAYEAERAEG